MTCWTTGAPDPFGPFTTDDGDTSAEQREGPSLSAWPTPKAPARLRPYADLMARFAQRGIPPQTVDGMEVWEAAAALGMHLDNGDGRLPPGLDMSAP